MNPKPEDLPRLCDSLENTAAWIRTYGPAILTASNIPIPQSPAGAGRISGGGVSDPTANQATSNVDGNAWLFGQQMILAAALSNLWEDAGTVVDIISRVHPKVVPPPAKSEEHGGPICQQETCTDRATRRGNCEACDKWLKRNDFTDGSSRQWVPEDVIADRVEARKKRRIRISGPNKGEAA